MFRSCLLVVFLLNTLRICGQHSAGTTAVYSQNQFSFEHFSQERGLSQGTVYAIASYDGYMWFGTQDGLNRFDGHNFKTFRARRGTEHTLNNSWIQALLADSKGRLWVGTVGGLCLYDAERENFQKVRIVLKTDHLIDSVSIEELIEDKQGNIWVVTDEHGLFRINIENQKIHSFLSGNNKIYGSCIARDGVLWVSTYDEIYYYNPKKDILEPMNIKKRLKRYLPKNALFQSILIDSQGDLWIGTYQEGVFRIKQPFQDDEISHYVKGNTSANITSNEIRDFMEDRDGRIWMGTKGGGVSIFDNVSKAFIHITGTDTQSNRLGEDHVMCLFQDRQGIIWAGLSNTGVDKYDPAKHFFGHIGQETDNLRSSSVYSIYERESNLYIGTESNLTVYSMKDRRFNKNLEQSFSGISFEAYSMSEDTSKNLWIATTDKGLYRFGREKGDVTSLNNIENDRMQYFLYAVKALKGIPEVWVGGHRGLERFDLNGNKLKGWRDIPSMEAVSDYTVRLLYEDSRRNVWIGTLGHGLLHYGHQDKRVATFDKKNGLLCENIRSVLEDGSTLWIGTDCGLFELDLKQSHVRKNYSENTAPPFQLPNDVIYGILKDDSGYLWLSSNRGLARFSPKSGVVKTYDVSDGLHSNEFNTNCAYKHTDGTMYFGSVDGITYFNPKDLKSNTFVPPVKITSIMVMDSVYPPNLKEITLPYDQNFINLEYVALNFSNSTKNQYKYRMTGIDEKWIHARSKREANYTNLPWGEFTFRVIGSNDDGLWNKTGASVKITILPPWWGTWWFRTLLVLLFAAGIYGLFRYRFAQQLRQREAEIRASLMAQEAERQRFSRELHDGIGANLSLLKMYLSSFGEADIPMAELKERSEKLLAGSVDEIRRLIHDMHPRNLREMGLVKAVDDMVGLVNLGNGLKVIFDATNVPEHLPEQLEINLFRIVQELLQNAMKHSGASSVWLNFVCGREGLFLSYKDNGVGFDTSIAPAGNGLLNIKNRVMLLKGEMRSKSSAGQGTAIEIDFEYITL
ncbi:histidine kinase [Dyadobacter sp. CY261]|uniref:ligand-binding sensor domain-containing protein n=1 Tax=Dyadobacter sp. CY261 TaxID=2907203 RepID=UPI001F15B32D|nr:sensor histidine kinase [Dyadobacter sp. CY261]MCF0074892.1 histidine kinase [Dyadobacter sp. CY261]